MTDLKQRVEDWLFWYHSWYDRITDKEITGLDDRAVDAAKIIEELTEREERLVKSLKLVLDLNEAEKNKTGVTNLITGINYERELAEAEARATLKDLGIE